MPELPEVETTRRGIAPLLCGKTVCDVILRTARLRWPIDPELSERLAGQTLEAVTRRAKYLIFSFSSGTLLLHLGMSGSLRVIPAGLAAGRHDHVDILFSDGNCLRLTDPRKFGAVLWSDGPVADHPLLARLGPEPFAADFNGRYLHQRSRRRQIAVKSLIMDQKVVVGVGNIYASEALFRAGIRPDRTAGSIAAARYDRLAEAVRDVLAEAIAAGGTTLQDFQQVDGRPGYFRQNLMVYGRAGEKCRECGGDVQSCRIGQRSTFFCRHCQR
ncbi:DNA-formamidopyrimidine glycosylase [Geothermobacter hydrogeniphilus]|uniref:Formamidopyrimidine-DNA glycosylase n=1 Tax=Geothermobacter hydrogeniphilus TaxID=1969733 RepID=A0A2K2HBP5_9BACT|nr:bifunctional DNA-formamidopyrimidine glycosylase/DNA-(apurinic or apyrimidinic site) lyase [Geothermobacter hydrogeniphilus]PNU20725.1 DNA-formamidopyrimidine glycosylase [Geothermobacter hydrogeniphilus]